MSLPGTGDGILGHHVNWTERLQKLGFSPMLKLILCVYLNVCVHECVCMCVSEYIYTWILTQRKWERYYLIFDSLIEWSAMWSQYKENITIVS